MNKSDIKIHNLKRIKKVKVDSVHTMKKLNLHELWDYRELFLFMVWRDVKVFYKQTIFGFTWAIIRPFFTMIVFSIVFGKLAKIPSDNMPYPIFYYTALVPWTYFSTSLIASGNSLVSNIHIFTKVYFPRLIIPWTPVFGKLIDFSISFAFLLAMMFYYGIFPTMNIFYIPMLVVLMVLTSSGLGMLLSAIGIKYRDVRHGMQFIVMLLMYATPVVYPASLIPEKYRLIYGLFPMSGVIEGFRSCLLRTRPMPWDLLAVGTCSAITLFLIGLIYFNLMEKNFADVA